MNTKTIALVALVNLPCAAEVIDGPANVREAPDGRALLALDDKVSVESKEYNNDWFNIDLPVYVDVKNAFADKAPPILNKGIKLYDERGVKIGITLEKVKADLFFDEDIHKGRKIVVLNASKALALEDFHDHIKSFRYKEWMPRERFISYIQFNRPTTDPTPWPRAILFFYEGKLVAVYHGRPIPSTRITASAKIRGDTMSYVNNIPQELRKKFSVIYYPIIEGAD